VDFSHEITVTRSTAENTIEARFRDDVLLITMHKTEAAKPEMIETKAPGDRGPVGSF
jgi:hypothetical protein